MKQYSKHGTRILFIIPFFILLLASDCLSSPSPDLKLSGSLMLPPVDPSIVLRQQRVVLDIDQLVDRSNESIQLEFFDDVSMTARLEQLDHTPDGSFIWQGRILDQPGSSALFVLNDAKITGEINSFQKQYHIRTNEDGIHIVQEIAVALPPSADRLAPLGVTDDVITLTNEERAKYGLPPLMYDARLTRAAQGHAEDMAQNNYYEHVGLDGRDACDRITDEGYIWNVCGENITRGYSNAVLAVNSWINSEAHHANMLKTDFCDIGVGYAYNSAADFGYYWVQDFGRRMGVTTCPQVPGKAPDAVTGTAAQVGADAVRLTGTVNPNGLNTTCYFQVGTSTAYGYTSPVQNAGSGTVPLFVEFTPSGFFPLVTYHYRLVAQNIAGFAYGPDKTFTVRSRLSIGALDLLLRDTTCPEIPNGNFESGNTVWNEDSSHPPIILNEVVLSEYGLSAHSGYYAARFGGVNNADDFIQQEVTVSSSCPFLTFYHWIFSSDQCGFDYGYVRINRVNLGTYQLCENGNTGGWVKKSIDLSAYAGQSIDLKFQGVTNGSVQSLWFVDDISFQTRNALVQ